MRTSLLPPFLLLGFGVLANTASIASQPRRSLSPRAGDDVSACKLPTVRSVGASLGFNRPSDCVPSNGTANALMLFVDFPDAPAAETPQSLRDFFLPQAADWFRDASYGRLLLNVTADATRFHRMPARSDSYGWSRGLTAALHTKYIQDALVAYNRTVSPAVDMLYIVVTARATAITSSFTSSTDSIRTRAGATAARKATTFGTTLYSSWGFKSLNHETGHALCLPDLYPLPTGANGLYTGGFDLMGLISGHAPDYFAWNKWRLGWLDDAQVGCVSTAGSTTHSLTALEKAGGGVKVVVIKRNATYAMVAELRKPIGVDSKLCAPGVLLYTISTNTASGNGPIRIVDTTPGSGGCGGQQLNDAALSLNRTRSFTVSDWGAKVTITSETADSATIQVDLP